MIESRESFIQLVKRWVSHASDGLLVVSSISIFVTICLHLLEQHEFVDPISRHVYSLLCLPGLLLLPVAAARFAITRKEHRGEKVALLLLTSIVSGGAGAAVPEILKKDDRPIVQHSCQLSSEADILVENKGERAASNMNIILASPLPEGVVFEIDQDYQSRLEITLPKVGERTIKLKYLNPSEKFELRIKAPQGKLIAQEIVKEVTVTFESGKGKYVKKMTKAGARPCF